MILTVSPLFLEVFVGPSNLQFIGQTSDSLRFRWSPAGGPVSAYVIQHVPLTGLGQPVIAEMRQVSSGVRPNNQIEVLPLLFPLV